MTVRICPRCNQRYALDNHNADYLHQCDSDNPTLDNEDILDLDNPSWNWLGLSNKLQGTDAQILRGANVDTKTSRGARAETHRQRQHFEYINTKEE